MMNYEAFDRELKASDHPDGTETDLVRLRRTLLDYRESACERADFHQRASWTRLRSRLDEAPRQRRLPGFFLAPVALPALMGVILGLWLIPETNDAIGKVEAPNIQISNRQPDIYVTPFHSKGVNADVIWAEGYPYIPASYSVTR